MYEDKIIAASFRDRALALLMSADRVFLFRKGFVMLSMVLVVTGLAVAQGKGGRTKERVVVGETKTLGDGEVRSWVSLDREGKPTAVGLTFSESSLNTLPKEPPPGAEGYDFSLELPREAASTAFKHVRFDWNPHGHPPEKIYDLAHFDFHFYMITREEREGITLQGEDAVRAKKAPASEFVPEGYVPVPDAIIPRMGAHWINPLTQELHGQTFTTTMLYGSYNGRLVFAEPMITKAFLETKTNITEAIKQPAKYDRRAYYPTKYSVRYDAARKEYTVALEGMMLR